MVTLTEPYSNFIAEVNELSGEKINVTAYVDFLGGYRVLVLMAVFVVKEREKVAEFVIRLSKLKQGLVSPSEVASLFVSAEEELATED